MHTLQEHFTTIVYAKSYGANKVRYGEQTLCTIRSHGTDFNYAGTQAAQWDLKTGLDWYEFLCFGRPTV